MTLTCLAACLTKPLPDAFKCCTRGEWQIQQRQVRSLKQKCNFIITLPSNSFLEFSILLGQKVLVHFPIKEALAVNPAARKIVLMGCLIISILTTKPWICKVDAQYKKLNKCTLVAMVKLFVKSCLFNTWKKSLV